MLLKEVFLPRIAGQNGNNIPDQRVIDKIFAESQQTPNLSGHTGNEHTPTGTIYSEEENSTAEFNWQI
jgi:hypothetical protein